MHRQLHMPRPHSPGEASWPCEAVRGPWLSRPPPLPAAPCEGVARGSTAAYDAMMGAAGLSHARYSSFIDALSRCSLQGERGQAAGGPCLYRACTALSRAPNAAFCPAAGSFRVLSRGKVVVAPTTHALHSALLRSARFRPMNGSLPQTVPPAACAALKAALPGLAVDTVRGSRGAALPARCLQRSPPAPACPHRPSPPPLPPPARRQASPPAPGVSWSTPPRRWPSPWPTCSSACPAHSRRGEARSQRRRGPAPGLSLASRCWGR